jgi:hypothetical protein
VSNNIWRQLFNKAADSLERSTENEDECKEKSSLFRKCVIIILDMIGEAMPVTNTFVSVPADMGDFNCASFIAGIIAGVLDSSKFVSFEVGAY